MGPFVPDPISEPLNLIVALFLGFAFGFVLEQAGFSSSRRLAGVFYGYDFTVLRVFFTAAATASAGVLLLGSAGLLDTSAIFVNPTWLWPAIVGGVIMGAGFIAGGYCPGTSVCAMAIGKLDALVFVGGGVLGVFGFAEAYPKLKHFYDSSSLGPVKVTSSLGISDGLFVFLLIAVAIGAFVLAGKVEKKVNPSSAPSLAFVHRHHVLAGSLALLAGAFVAFLAPYESRLLARVSNEGFLARHPVKVMTADELAFRILDREPLLKVIDIRPAAEYGALPLPSSVNLPVKELFGKDATAVLADRRVKKVVAGISEREEHSAALLIQELGYENVAILEGGVPGFKRTILDPAGTAQLTGGRWDKDVAEFRDQARVEIPKLIAAAKTSGEKKPKVQKKVQGGC